MAVEFFCAYHSYLDAMEPLTDAERGRLFVACLEYSKSGATRHLSGNERFIFPMIRAQIDRDNEKYRTRCKKQSDNVSKRWNKESTNDTTVYDGIKDIPPYQSDTDDTNDTKEKAKEKTKTKEKEKEKGKKKEKETERPTPAAQAPISNDPFAPYLFSPALKTKLSSWISYKRDRRETYTPQQLTALLQTVQQKLTLYPEDSILSLIDQCMVAGWRNIIFERLEKPGAVPRNTGPRPLDADETAAIRRMFGGENNAPL